MAQRFDQGPSLLLLPRLFEEAFEDLDTTLEKENVHIVKCEPNYNIWFGDGKSFEMSSDLATMKTEIEKWEGKGGFERYLSYLQEAHKHYELSVTHVLKKNFYSLLSMARPSFLRHLIDLHPFESIYSRASKYFWTERMRRVFTFASMYMGMSPFDAPGTYSLLQYTELAEGIWYPIGGFNKVIQGLVAIGKRTGVDYKLSTPIQNIELSPDKKRATGVKLSNGQIHNADIVICNADLVYAYNNLLPSNPYALSLAARPTSCSSLSFYWSLKKPIPQLRAHNIFLADEYQKSFDSIFKDHLIPEEPSFYVNVPSRIDASAAPKGCDAIVVLCPVGHLISSYKTEHKGTSNADGTTQDWPAIRALARKKILHTMETRLGVDIGSNIIDEYVNDPMTWKEEFNLDKGAILGLSHSFFNVLSFRPGTKHSSIKGMYFVGASTHPGTGVPICLAGAKIVSEQILEDYKMDVPWGPGGLKMANTGKGIDREKRPVPWLPLLLFFLVGLFGRMLIGGDVINGFLKSNGL